MITLNNVPAGTKVLELGCGENRNPAATCAVDVRPLPNVDFQVDLSEFPWAIQSEEWDIVIGSFIMEHISFLKVPDFIREVFRILKPGGRAVFLIPNTEAQMKWIQEHQEGWDGKDLFYAASEKLFGSQSMDFDANSHRVYFSPMIVSELFQKAGFKKITISPFNERGTDMAVDVAKPTDAELVTKITEAMDQNHFNKTTGEEKPKEIPPPEKIFDRQYFNGGKMGGGYGGVGYTDFACHYLTAQHVLDRKPSSVLEIGCGRGYVTKQLQDAGITADCIDISEHCYQTRACDYFYRQNLWNTPWRTYSSPNKYDLLLSVSVLENIPEQHLPTIFAEMERVSERGLHGVDFGNGESSDKTKFTLRPKSWWMKRLPKGHEVVDKNELESGDYPESFFKGDGKVKLNIGCAQTQFYYGWQNLDILDQSQFAQAFGYNFKQCDARGGLPYNTGSVNLIYNAHMLEHLTYKEGRNFLIECRRVLHPQTGAMRIIVPHARELMDMYFDSDTENAFDVFDELNEDCAKLKSPAQKLYTLLHGHHFSMYDEDTLLNLLDETGFEAYISAFRTIATPSTPSGSRKIDGMRQILKETLDVLPDLSLYVEAYPKIG